MYPFMGEVPDFLAMVEKKFHAHAPARNILLLLHRSDWEPAPQMLLAFRLIFYHHHGERAQFTAEHHLAVRRLKHKRKLLCPADFGRSEEHTSELQSQFHL